MKRKSVLAGLAVTAATALLLAACSGASSTPSGKPAGNPEAGKTVFANNCNSCHPNASAGVGPEIKGKDVETIKKQVRNGGKQMPPFPASKISDQQLDDVAAYVNSLK